MVRRVKVGNWWIVYSEVRQNDNVKSMCHTDIVTVENVNIVGLCIMSGFSD